VSTNVDPSTSMWQQTGSGRQEPLTIEVAAGPGSNSEASARFANKSVLAVIRQPKGRLQASPTEASSKNEAAAKAKGVKRICIPNRSTKSAERRREQKKRWFRNGQKWRTGCEGRISVAKRRHGLNRCRYKGDNGMKRWVGLGVIADNLVNIGRVRTTKR
jgi:hypothetical protein